MVVTSRTGVVPDDVDAEFSRAGVSLITLKADASNAAEMTATLEFVREELPYIQHYAHAAGVSGFDMLADLEMSVFWRVADPKVWSEKHFINLKEGIMV